MREFTLNFDEQFNQGLRRSIRQNRGGQALVKCLNLEPSPYGLRPYKKAIAPASDLTNFPFPKLAFIQGHALLFFEDEVYEAIPDPSFYSDPVTVVGNIASGGVWDVVQDGPILIATNGETVIISDPHAGANNIVDTLQAYTSVSFEAVSHHRGRYLMGGFTQGEVWNNDWLALFDDINPDDHTPFSDNILGVAENWVMWSSIGGWELPYWLLDETHVPDSDTFLRRIKQNDIGWIPIHGIGKVLQLIPFQDTVIAYGTQGIAMLMPFADSRGTGYGVEKLSKVGIPNKGAVGGNRNTHLWLDNHGAFRIITEEGQEFLDFHYIGIEMLGADVQVSFNGIENAFYISSTNDSYCFQNGRMYQIEQAITSGQPYDGGFVGPFSQVNSEEGLVVTDTFGMNEPSIKTITNLRFFGDKFDGLETKMQYRYRTSDENWRETDWKAVKRGVVYLRVSGTEFRLMVRCDDARDMELDKIHVSYQRSDRRHIRGPLPEGR